MRIGIDIVTTQNQDSHLGKGVYTKEVVKRIIEKNREDEIFLFRYDAPSTLDSMMASNRLAKGHSSNFKPIYPNVTMVNCGRFWEGMKSIPVLLDGLWFSLFFLPTIRSYNLDVFFAPMPFRGIPHQYTKTVSVVHDILQVPLDLYSERGKIVNEIKKYEYWYDLKTISKSDAIITDTEYTRDDLEKYVKIPKNKIEVVLLGIDQSLMQPTSSSLRILESYNISEPYLLYLGGVDRSKNIEQLIRVFHLLINKYPNLKHKLVLAGSGFSKENPRGSKYIELVEKLNLQDRVVFPGFIESEDQAHIYSSADAYITLSKYEGFGLPAVEAMKCGTSVIASNTSCHPEVLGEYAVLVDLKDDETIANKIYQVLKNKKVREMIEKEGKNFVEKYSWDLAAEKTLDILRRVANT